MSKMLDFYGHLLGAAGLVVTDDGCVSVRTSKDPKPMTLKGRRLVLPTKEHQANPNPETKILFHPLQENVMRGESEVFERYRMALNSRLNLVIASMMTLLLTVGTSEADQQKLSPEQTEFLSKVKNADKKTVESFKKILDSIPAAQHQKLFVSMFLKRAGTVDGKRYSRVGVVHFPFYTELKKSEGELHGVKLRVKDREALVGLLDYILPDQDVLGAYNRGSNSSLAPSIDALMQSFRLVAGPVNDLLARFEDVLPDNLMIESGWSEQLDILDTDQQLLNEIRSTPMQAGNEGAVGENAQAAQGGLADSKNAAPGLSFSSVRVAPTAAPQQQNQQPPQASLAWGSAPASSNQPVTRGPTGGTDFESLVRGNQALQKAVGYGGSHGWNPGQSWQQVPQRASLSNPSAPVNTGNSWGGGGWNTGGGSFGQGGSWGNNGGWGNNTQYRL